MIRCKCNGNLVFIWQQIDILSDLLPMSLAVWRLSNEYFVSCFWEKCLSLKLQHNSTMQFVTRRRIFFFFFFFFWWIFSRVLLLEEILFLQFRSESDDKFLPRKEKQKILLLFAWRQICLAAGSSKLDQHLQYSGGESGGNSLEDFQILIFFYK